MDFLRHSQGKEMRSGNKRRCWRSSAARRADDFVRLPISLPGHAKTNPAAKPPASQWFKFFTLFEHTEMLLSLTEKACRRALEGPPAVARIRRGSGGQRPAACLRPNCRASREFAARQPIPLSRRPVKI
jgi:hypothetical protein